MVEIINAVIPIAKIKPHPENYNRHPDEQIRQLEASYDEFGQFNSIVVWQRPGDEYIQVAREGFLTGATNKGATEIRADILPEDTDPLVIKRILIADNLHAKNSIPDDTLLAQLLEEQKNAGYDLAGLGTDDDALTDLLAKLTPPTLDELTEQYGDEPEDDAFWPVIRVKVSPETKELYDSLMDEAEGTDEGVKFAWLLERVNMADEVEV